MLHYTVACHVYGSYYWYAIIGKNGNFNNDLYYHHTSQFCIVFTSYSSLAGESGQRDYHTLLTSLTKTVVSLARPTQGGEGLVTLIYTLLVQAWRKKSGKSGSCQMADMPQLLLICNTYVDCAKQLLPSACIL